MADLSGRLCADPMDTMLPDPPLAPRLVVGAAIVDDLDRPTRLLAARRTGPPALAGGWELPGGKVDPGEDSVTALHREVREELGVLVELGKEVPGPVDGAWPLGDRYVMRVWLARVTDRTAGAAGGPRRAALAGPGRRLRRRLAAGRPAHRGRRHRDRGLSRADPDRRRGRPPHAPARRPRAVLVTSTPKD